jgi:hypothetical protein
MIGRQENGEIDLSTVLPRRWVEVKDRPRIGSGGSGGRTASRAPPGPPIPRPKAGRIAAPMV